MAELEPVVEAGSVADEEAPFAEAFQAEVGTFDEDEPAHVAEAAPVAELLPDFDLEADAETDERPSQRPLRRGQKPTPHQSKSPLSQLLQSRSPSPPS